MHTPIVPKFRFAPASDTENCIYGSERPGYGSKAVSNKQVEEWLSFMDDQRIERVCCLLDEEQLGYYQEKPLLEIFGSKYGSANVLHASIPDFQLCSLELLVKKILPFLEDSKSQQKKTVVHCAGGKGRTGHVLAAWLVRSEGKTSEEAIATVTAFFREPLEAVERGNATFEDLKKLLLEEA
jgi:protein-tyrosine phosphatase